MPKLSLAIIAGNVEQYLPRFLDAFQPLADEIVVVRACGGREPDKTLEIAKERGCFVSVYENDHARKDWPHVDNFAAARQRAFDLATSEWVMWADTDDVISPESIAAIRAALESPQMKDLDGILIPYDVPEDGVKIYRERILRRGKWRWRSPVHEHLEFTGQGEPKMMRLNEAHILHLPHKRPQSSDERNLRILESIDPKFRTLSHGFHLFQSARALGRMELATKTALEMLGNPELGTDERYELLLALAQMSTDPKVRHGMILQAIDVAPGRREAYGEMAVNCLHLQNPESALAWSTSMLAHHSPRELSWNARRKFFGWQGVEIHAIALRANGRDAEADAIQYNHFKAHGAKISLLHATRGRAKRAIKCIRRWQDTAKDFNRVEHIFAIDADDRDSLENLTLWRSVIVEPGGGCVRAWNAAAAVSSGHLLVQLSDDWEPVLHWDEILLERIGDLTKPAVLAISDGHRTDKLLCMSILTRARYKQQGGFLYHPAFEQAAMFSDNYFTEMAYRDGVVIEARDVVFEHQHPAFDKSVPVDETYARQNAPEKYQRGEEIFKRLMAQQA